VWKYTKMRLVCYQCGRYMRIEDIFNDGRNYGGNDAAYKHQCLTLDFTPHALPSCHLLTLPTLRHPATSYDIGLLILTCPLIRGVCEKGTSHSFFMLGAQYTIAINASCLTVCLSVSAADTSQSISSTSSHSSIMSYPRA